MKTAYELAMERLNKTRPVAKLSDAQKKELAELDSKYAAKIAEREITLKGAIGSAAAEGNLEEAEKLARQLADDLKSLKSELDDKKEQVRKAK